MWDLDFLSLKAPDLACSCVVKLLNPINQWNQDEFLSSFSSALQSVAWPKTSLYTYVYLKRSSPSCVSTFQELFDSLERFSLLNGMCWCILLYFWTILSQEPVNTFSRPFHTLLSDLRTSKKIRITWAGTWNLAVAGLGCIDMQIMHVHNLSPKWPHVLLVRQVTELWDLNNVFILCWIMWMIHEAACLHVSSTGWDYLENLASMKSVKNGDSRWETIWSVAHVGVSMHKDSNFQYLAIDVAARNQVF